MHSGNSQEATHTPVWLDRGGAGEWGDEFAEMHRAYPCQPPAGQARPVQTRVWEAEGAGAWGVTRSDLQFGSIALAAASSMDWRGWGGGRGRATAVVQAGEEEPHWLLRALCAPSAASVYSESFPNRPHPAASSLHSALAPHSVGWSLCLSGVPMKGLACRFPEKYDK